MNESTMKRRVWIRNIIIIFLLVLLVLTFFSNTILNYSLPEVAVQYPRYATIASRIRASGTVTANQTTPVTIDQGRVIEKVAVRVGQTVQAGEILFTLKKGDSTELESLLAERQNLNLQLLSKMQADPSLKNTETSDPTASLRDQLETTRQLLEEHKLTLTTLENDLAKLERDLTSIREDEGKLPTYEELLEAKNTVELTTRNLAALTEERDRLIGKRNSVGSNNGYYTDDELAELLASSQKEYENMQRLLGEALVAYENALQTENSWQKRVEDALTAKQNADRAVSDYQATMGGASVTTEALMKEMQALQEKQQEITERQNAVAAGTIFAEEEKLCRAAYESARSAYETALKSGTASAEQLASLKSALAQAESAYQPYQAERAAIQVLLAEYSSMQQSYYRNMSLYSQSSQQSTMLESLKSAAIQADAQHKDMSAYHAAAVKETTAKKDAYDKAKIAFDDAETELRRIESFHSWDELDGQIKELDAMLKEIEGQKADAEAVIERASDTNKTDVSDRLTAKNEEIAAKKNAIANKKKDITNTNSQITKLQGQITDAQAKAEADAEAAEQQRKLELKRYQIELQQIKDQIIKTDEKIILLEENTVSGTVTAPVSGTIESIAVSAGQTAAANTPLAQITVADQGYSLQCTVTSEQAAKVQVGEAAELQWYYWGDAPTARVVSIKSDPQSQGRSKIITLEITGAEIAPGTSLTFNLGAKNESYDTVVPSSAVREDAEGTFVLVVTAKSTPLGNRYTARRVEVSVLASDDTNSAISGAISGEYVITTSSTPISDGMQVRLSENG